MTSQILRHCARCDELLPSEDFYKGAYVCKRCQANDRLIRLEKYRAQMVDPAHPRHGTAGFVSAGCHCPKCEEKRASINRRNEALREYRIIKRWEERKCALKS